MNLRQRIAKWVFDHRLIASGLILGVTVFFGAGLPWVKIQTIFSDLLPVGHPFSETYRDHPNFGNPLTVTVMIERTDGEDIYHTETLQKVWDMTRDIDLAPGVDHDQILSITTSKARYAEATPYGINSRPLMDDQVPQTQAEIDDFVSRVERSPNVRGFLISNDAKSTLVNATFIERLLDYGDVFEYVYGLVEEAKDENHMVYMAGQPILTGWVYRYQTQMLYIFGITLAALFISLFLYMRNVAGVVTPMVTGVVSAIWGFGFTGWLGLEVEPLLLLVPLLLVARAFSHTVQYTERFYEILNEVKDKEKAGELALNVMMGPGTLGVITDALAILLIILAPVPAMQRFALFCGFWAFILIPCSVFLAPLILSIMPVPKNLDSIVGRDEDKGGFHAAMAGFLTKLARACTGGAAKVTGVVFVIVGAISIFYGFQIKVGNPVEGSSLLWQDSRFNVAVRTINDNFPGVNTLEIILEANEQEGPGTVARKQKTVEVMTDLQDYMENHNNPPRATLSFADYLREANRLYQGGDPRWAPIDPDAQSTNAAAQAAMMGTGPKAFSHVVDFRQKNSTVSLWYKDNKQETVDEALANARKAIEKVGTEHELFKIRLGTGTIALQQAVNDTVEANYWEIIIFLNILMFVLAGIAFRSAVAGFILLVPVNMANFVIVASMSLMGVGLDINSVLVAAVGVGVGIDYGIYLLARICEEYTPQGGDFEKIIVEAVTTTGRAIFFTASIMLIGILPWYFLSELKFLADMGLLLSLVMVINMVMALMVLPLLVWFIKPKFCARDDLFVTEEIDTAQMEAMRREVEARQAG
ncbi:MAG: RND transporter [Salinisphaeraceae bacterium]|jgi:predicted RND superfamily exporter protein|nr:RND transporter [Salinisphaeraceae bacterium]